MVESRPANQVRLFQAQHFADAWEPVIAPWFRDRAELGWKNAQPGVALISSQAAAAFLKSRLVEADIPVFNTAFMTPGTLRKFLIKHNNPGRVLALREDLRLLLSVAAENLKPSNPVAQSVAADPGGLLGAWDAVQGAGLDYKSLSGKTIRTIAGLLEEMLEEAGLWSTQKADWELAKVQRSTKPGLAALLVWGFGAKHWPLFPLLKAGVMAAESAHVCLNPGRGTSSDQAWLGTWEEQFGSAEPLGVGDPKAQAPFTGLARNFESGAPGEVEFCKVNFRLGANCVEESKIVIAQTLDYLSSPDCHRLGIALPPGSVLAREVAAELTALDIPHHDTLGYYAGQPANQALLNRWTDFQKEPRLAKLRAFLELRRQMGLETSSHSKSVQNSLQKAFDLALVDDLAVLEACLGEIDPDCSGLKFLKQWPRLPEKALFSEFLRAAQPTLSDLGWKGEVEDLMEDAAHVSKALMSPFTRLHFLDWLDVRLPTPGRLRPPGGRHPLANVQLLDYEQVGGQSFSHLILAGLNRGHWPREMDESAFLPETQRQGLNRKALRQGSQGEGHICLVEGKGLLPGPADHRAAAQSELQDLLESVGVALAVTASLAAEDDFRQPAQLSDFYLKLYYADRGKLLGQMVRDSLYEATRRWLKDWPEEAAKGFEGEKQMLRAYEARRDPGQPFGEYEYGFREPPSGGLRLSCKTWETVMKRPASVWMESVLRIRKPKSLDRPVALPLVIGSWVHDWLGLETEGGFNSLAEAGRWLEGVNSRAQGLRDRMQRAFHAAGRDLPDWWTSGWAEALSSAKRLAQSLAEVEGWPYVASELKLPADTTARISRDFVLPVTGIIDLVFANAPLLAPGKPWPEDSTLWVIDFKTGQDRPMSKSGLSRGEGLQLALYALALRSLGGGKVDVTLLRPGQVLVHQLDLETMLELTELWKGLRALQERGILGMAGPLRSSHSFVGDYPLATLSISREVLEAKWDRTHPGLPYPKIY